MIPFPFISFDLVRLSDIQVEDMPYTIMQGIDEEGRFFLAQKVFHEGTLQVGFIIQKIPGEEEQWDYGLLGQMDTYVKHCHF
jgi:hypothetical protein